VASRPKAASARPPPIRTIAIAATFLVYDPGTALPIREIARILRRSCPAWTYSEVPGAGHMAPLTQPELINPLVSSFLAS
jgi:pimeloyl-ACP methyl ester carboxylesterase